MQSNNVLCRSFSRHNFSSIWVSKNSTEVLLFLISKTVRTLFSFLWWIKTIISDSLLCFKDNYTHYKPFSPLLVSTPTHSIHASDVTKRAITQEPWIRTQDTSVGPANPLNSGLSLRIKDVIVNMQRAWDKKSLSPRRESNP